MENLVLPVTYKIVVTPETSYRGIAKNNKGNSFIFELLFNEVEFKEDFEITFKSAKQLEARNEIIKACITSVIRRAVAHKYKKHVVCDGFILNNLPYYKLEKKGANEHGTI